MVTAAVFSQVLAIMHGSFREEKCAVVFGAFGPLARPAGRMAAAEYGH